MKFKKIVVLSCVLLLGTALRANDWNKAVEKFGGIEKLEKNKGTIPGESIGKLVSGLTESQEIRKSLIAILWNKKAQNPRILRLLNEKINSATATTVAEFKNQMDHSGHTGGASAPPPPPATWGTDYAGLAAAAKWTYKEDVPVSLPAEVGGKKTTGITAAQVRNALHSKPVAPPPPPGGGGTADATEVARLKAQLAAAQAEASRVAGLETQVAAERAEKEKAEREKVAAAAAQATAEKQAQFVTNLKDKLDKSNNQANNQALLAKAFLQEMQAVRELLTGDSLPAEYKEVLKKLIADLDALRSKDFSRTEVEKAITLLEKGKTIELDDTTMDEKEVDLLPREAQAVFAQIKDIGGAATGGATAYRAHPLGRLSAKRSVAAKKHARRAHRSQMKKAARRHRKAVH